MKNELLNHVSFEGVCVKFEVKLTKNQKEYADVTFKDNNGKLYNCKIWDWKENLREFLAPYKYVLMVVAQKSDYQGVEQYIIKDLSVSQDANVKDIISNYIDTEAQFIEYKNFIDSELCHDSWWYKIINTIIEDNTLVIKNGIIDSRPGGNINGTLLKTAFNITRMAFAVAPYTGVKINYGYLSYIILISTFARGRMFSIQDDGQAKQSDDVSFLGYVGMPVLYIQKLFTREELRGAPESVKLLAIHGVLSNVMSNDSGIYPPVVNNTPEGRIAYHCQSIEYSTSIMNFYFGDKGDGVMAIPELNDKIKFILPYRLEASPTINQ